MVFVLFIYLPCATLHRIVRIIIQRPDLREGDVNKPITRFVHFSCLVQGRKLNPILLFPINGKATGFLRFECWKDVV